MSARATPKKLLLSTATLLGALTGYGRDAYSQVVCVADPAPPNFTCSGASTDPQTITSDDATVVTEAGFSVSALTVAVTITGDGALSYTDTNASSLTSQTIGLYVQSNGDVGGGNAGSVTINTNGAISASFVGIDATNDGSGALEIITNGNVNGALRTGIFAENAGTDLSITTGAGTTVTGDDHGISATNNGTGTLTIVANGNVTSDDQIGIEATNSGTDLSVTTGAGTTVMGTIVGIDANNNGSGQLAITANGNVTGTTGYGIDATNAGSNLTLSTGSGTTVSGRRGVRAAGTSGETTVVVHGNITGTNGNGLVASNFVGGTKVKITTDANTTVKGVGTGIFASARYGSVDATINGEVLSTGGSFGLLASAGDALPTGTGIAITTGKDSSLQGNSGITANNFGTGAVSIAVNGDVTGTIGSGIVATNNGGNEIVITTGAGSNVNGGVAVTSFAVASNLARTDLTVAGTLNGGTQGAVQFDQVNAFANRLEIQPTAVVNGNVLGGPGTDTLAFGGSGNGTFDLNDIDDGANTLQFQNFETFQVESGTWSFSGTTTQAFTQTGGTLKGTGSFGGLTVNGGTVAPGNSIGTMTVNGAFTLSGGAVYEVEVNAAGQGDKVIVNGTVNLTGATLKVLAENGNYNPKTDYTIIENDGSDAVVGTFTSVSTNLAFLTPQVNYAAGDGNDVVLTLLRTVDSDGGVVTFKDIAQTRNEKAVAGALDKFPTSNPLFLAVLTQTADGARQAFNGLSGEVHATVAGTLVDDSRYAREAVLGRLMQASHMSGALGANGPQVASYNDGAMRLGSKFISEEMAAAPERQPLAFWTQGFGAWGSFDGDGNAATADRNLGGFISGMDASIGGSWRVGLATGASFSDVSVDQRYSGANTKTYHLGGYAGGEVEGFALRGGGLWAWSEIETSRAVVFPNFFERQKADYDADTGQLFGEIAYPTTMGGVELEPFAGLAYVSVESGGFKERGGPQASLKTSGFDQDIGYTTVGLRAAKTFLWGTMHVTPHIEAAWLHAFDDVTPDASLAFATTGIGFDVAGVPLAEDSALLDAGLDFAVTDRLSAGVSYSGQYADDVSDNAVKGRVTWLFH